MNGEVLIKYQKKKNLNATHISLALGRHPSWFNKVSTGKAQLRSEYIKPLSMLLGVRPEKLVKEYFLPPEVEKISTINDGN
jgi:cyanate lyase